MPDIELVEPLHRDIQVILGGGIHPAEQDSDALSIPGGVDDEIFFLTLKFFHLDENSPSGKLSGGDLRGERLSRFLRNEGRKAKKLPGAPQVGAKRLPVRSLDLFVGGFAARLELTLPGSHLDLEQAFFASGEIVFVPGRDDLEILHGPGALENRGHGVIVYR